MTRNIKTNYTYHNTYIILTYESLRYLWLQNDGHSYRIIEKFTTNCSCVHPYSCSTSIYEYLIRLNGVHKE